MLIQLIFWKDWQGSLVDQSISRSVDQSISRSVDQSISRSVDQSISRSELTTRQREVLGLIAQGLTGKEIAASLHISVKTVDNHRKQIMERLNVRNFASLILVAVRLGLISLDE